MNSRTSGDIFEYYLVQAILLKEVEPKDPYTKEKTEKLCAKCEASDTLSIAKRTVLIGKLEKFLSFFPNISHYAMKKDGAGCKNDTTDVVIYCAKGIYNISCKRNNVSAKHPRPSNLCAQLKMNADECADYKKEYKELNDEWFEKFAGFANFSEVENKNDMYRAFNVMCEAQIDAASEEQLRHFLDFILSNEIKNKIILEYNDKSNMLRAYNCEKLEYPDSAICTIDAQAPNNMKIEFVKDDKRYFEIKMRIHTASKRITKSLSLKYDVTIPNIMDVYKTIDV
jgi:hypothetical protein